MTHRMLQTFFAPRRNPNLHSMWKTEGRDLYRNTEHARSGDHTLLALSPEAGRELLLDKIPKDGMDPDKRAFLLAKVVPFLRDDTGPGVKSWEPFEGLGLSGHDRGDFVGGTSVEWNRPETLPDGFIDDLQRNGFASLAGDATPQKGVFTGSPSVLSADTPSKGQGAIRMAVREKVSLPVAMLLKQSVIPNLSAKNLVLRVAERENGYAPRSFIAVTYRAPGPRSLVGSMKALGFKLDAKFNSRLLSKDGADGWTTYVLQPVR